MKVIVGIDESSASQAALEYVLRLKLADLRLILVNSVESVLPDGAFIDSKGHPVADLTIENRKSGAKLLEEAKERARGFGVDAETQICLGNPGETLSFIAEEKNADLIAVGGNRRSAWDEFLLGSTAKRLLHDSPRHLLIARAVPKSEGELNALVAVDQRFESAAYLDALTAMRPKGIAAIDLVTVNRVDESKVHHLVEGLPVTVGVAEGWVASGLRHGNEALAQRLEGLGVECVPRVVQGDVPERALVEWAEKNQADLIVVGAHPHGFIDRHLHHSVSEGLLSAGPRALLVLRHEANG